MDLKENFRDCQLFIRLDGVVKQTRVLHGSTNTVAHIEESVQEILGDLEDNMIVWLDDMLMYAKVENHLLLNLGKFFHTCRKYILKLHPQKVQIHTSSILWCDRDISKEGVRLDPRFVQGFRDLEFQWKGSGLHKFVLELKCMRTEIPIFLTKIAPLPV